MKTLYIYLLIFLVIVGVAFSADKYTMQYNSHTRSNDWIYNPDNTVPTSPTSDCDAGTMAYESGYIYMCVSDNVWQRSALTTWVLDSHLVLTHSGNNLITHAGNTVMSQ